MLRLLTPFVLSAPALLSGHASLAASAGHETYSTAERVMGGFVLAAVSLVVVLVLAALTARGDRHGR